MEIIHSLENAVYTEVAGAHDVMILNDVRIKTLKPTFWELIRATIAPMVQ
jgi:hypothetical protein